MLLVLVIIIFTMATTYCLYSRLVRDELEVSLKKAILITGCDSGIGLQLAQYFYNKRLTTICGYIDNKSEGYRQLKKMSSGGTEKCLHLIKLDITSQTDIADTVKFVADATESNKFELHALINNAGVCIYGEFDWLTSEQIENLLSINLVGSINLTRALLRFLIVSKGRLINVSSVNDSIVFPGLSIYSATKSAISTFSKGLSYELKKFGMNVTIIRLGDFAKLTNIMSRHEHNKDQMWSDMSEDKKVLYKDFFNRFNDHILSNYGMTSPKNFLQSNLFKDFNRAVLSKSPPYIITCTTPTFRIFYWTLEQLPTGMQHILLDLMFSFAFGWQSPSWPQK